MEYMAGIPDGFFELAVVDPPYQLGLLGRVGVRASHHRGGGASFVVVYSTKVRKSSRSGMSLLGRNTSPNCEGSPKTRLSGEATISTCRRHGALSSGTNVSRGRTSLKRSMPGRASETPQSCSASTTALEGKSIRHRSQQNSTTTYSSSSRKKETRFSTRTLAQAQAGSRLGTTASTFTAAKSTRNTMMPLARGLKKNV